MRHRLRRYLLLPNAEDLDALKALVEAGHLAPVIGRVHPSDPGSGDDQAGVQLLEEPGAGHEFGSRRWDKELGDQGGRGHWSDHVTAMLAWQSLKVAWRGRLSDPQAISTSPRLSAGRGSRLTRSATIGSVKKKVEPSPSLET